MPLIFDSKSYSVVLGIVAGTPSWNCAANALAPGTQSNKKHGRERFHRKVRRLVRTTQTWAGAASAATFVCASGGPANAPAPGSPPRRCLWVKRPVRRSRWATPG